MVKCKIARMPSVRHGVTHRFTVGGQKGFITTGVYSKGKLKGKLGEIFLVVAKVGMLERGLFHVVALLVSICLQHGVPLEKIVRQLKGISFEPRGVTSNRRIPMANSIIDYVGRWLELKFLMKEPDNEGN